MGNPPPLDLPGDLHPHEKVQYYRCSLNAQRIMTLWIQNRNPEASMFGIKARAQALPNSKGKDTFGAKWKGNHFPEHGLIRCRQENSSQVMPLLED